MERGGEKPAYCPGNARDSGYFCYALRIVMRIYHVWHRHPDFLSFEILWISVSRQQILFLRYP